MAVLTHRKFINTVKFTLWASDFEIHSVSKVTVVGRKSWEPVTQFIDYTYRRLIDRSSIWTANIRLLFVRFFGFCLLKNSFKTFAAPFELLRNLRWTGMLSPPSDHSVKRVSPRDFKVWTSNIFKSSNGFEIFKKHRLQIFEQNDEHLEDALFLNFSITLFLLISSPLIAAIVPPHVLASSDCTHRFALKRYRTMCRSTVQMFYYTGCTL